MILDLEPIMVKLMDKKEGLGWSLEFVTQVALEYKKFLFLCKEKPNKSIVPCAFVDEFWHFHILDTQKYQINCQDIFGYFLHHFPYFGMRSKEDEVNLNLAWTETNILYKTYFGDAPNNLWLSSNRCPNCGRRGESDIQSYLINERPRLAA